MTQRQISCPHCEYFNCHILIGQITIYRFAIYRLAPPERGQLSPAMTKRPWSPKLSRLHYWPAIASTSAKTGVVRRPAPIGFLSRPTSGRRPARDGQGRNKQGDRGATLQGSNDSSRLTSTPWLALIERTNLLGLFKDSVLTYYHVEMRVTPQSHWSKFWNWGLPYHPA